MKRTIRHNVFETNSSTMHTLTLYNNKELLKDKKFPKPEEIGTINLMTEDEWFEVEHFGIKDKFRAIMSDGYIAHPWNIEGCKKILTEVKDMINKEYNTNIELNWDDTVEEEWNYGDGNASVMIDYSGIENNEEFYIKQSPEKKQKPLNKIIIAHNYNEWFFEEEDKDKIVSYDFKDIISTVKNLYDLIMDNNISIKVIQD